MLTPQYILDINNEIIVDNFSGGGGASTGIELALGRHVDIAINHDAKAIAMHQANHPQTVHYCESVWDVNPREVMPGRPIGLMWLSPDCKHFSKAKGGKPVEKKIRGLAWIGLRWVALRRPRVLLLENVEEFITWGPLGADSKPCKKNKGREFNCFINALKRHGYAVEWRELRACDYGAPTIRKRLFLVARCDGMPIVWPAPTHGAPDSVLVKSKILKPWLTAADCIDFSLPCPSIFLSKEEARQQNCKRPLAPATMQRIGKGVIKYVLDNPSPFIVTMAHGDGEGKTKRWGEGVRSIDQPLPTITASGGYALATPFISEHANASNQRNMPADEPLRTQCAQVKGGHFSLVTAFLAKHYTGVVGSDVGDPIGTVTTVDHHSLVLSHLVKFRNGQDGQDVTEPMPTLTAGGTHVGEVRAFLVKYYGTDQDPQLLEPLHTITTKDRFGLVQVQSEFYSIVDIGLRMLTPRELFNAQGFPASYIIDKGMVIDQSGRVQWISLTKTEQVRMVGNSVSPYLACALVSANVPELIAISNPSPGKQRRLTHATC